MQPPPVPTSARPSKGIPGWSWPIIIGAPLLLFAEILVWQQAKQLIVEKQVETPMEAWHPAMGVPQTQPGEQLSVSPDGAFAYRNKQTGVERTIRNELEPVAEPAWLKMPAEVRRVKAEGRRGGGRRQALFQYSMERDLDGAFTDFGIPLMAEGLSLRRDSRKLAMQFIGVDAQREVFVYAKRTGKVTQVDIHITEPDRR